MPALLLLLVATFAVGCVDSIEAGDQIALLDQVDQEKGEPSPTRKVDTAQRKQDDAIERLEEALEKARQRPRRPKLPAPIRRDEVSVKPKPST